ncbi:MAG: CHAT domain-containing tetratricopeptide repeat protein, partial [Rhizonema sp. PD38]|nr:CHAT domain-containing tetratricopeptide repeat protein [Rhizonema sp. PD38]
MHVHIEFTSVTQGITQKISPFLFFFCNCLFLIFVPLPTFNCQTSALVWAQTPDREAEAALLLQQGMQQYQKNQFLEALRYLQQALTLYKEIKDPLNEGKVLHQLGKVNLNLGNYAKVIEYEQQWLKIAQDLKNRQAEATALGLLGITYFYLGNYTEAIKYEQQSLTIARDLKDQGGEGAALGNLGNAYLALNNYVKAIESEQQHLQIAREMKDRDAEAVTLLNLGVIYSKKGEYTKAIDYEQQALMIAQFRKNQRIEARTLGALGIAYFYLRDYTKAIKYEQQWLAIAQVRKDRQGEAKALGSLGEIYWQTRRFPEAETTLYKAIEVLESLRPGLSDSNKVSIFDLQTRTYVVLQQVLVAQNKNNKALEMAERGRARAFVELLASKIAFQPSQQLPSAPNIQQIQQIAKTENATIVQYSIIYDYFKVQGQPKTKESELYIWVIKPTGEVTFRRTDLKPLWQQQDISLEDQVAQARQSIVKGVNTASRGNQITLTPGDRVKLNDDDSDWEAWQVVSVDVKNGKITIRLPSWEAGKPPIERPILDVVKKIGRNSSSTNTKNSQLQELYQLLIQPIADILPKDETARIIFIPQNALFLVPFPALQDPSGQYLIDQHTILTAPSIQVLDSTHKLRQKVPGSAKDILVVGNPTMPKVAKKPGQPPQQLASLPNSEKEAKAIASIFQTQPLIGKQATKASILPLLLKARIIHLATHGLLDDFTGGGVPGAVALASSGNDNGLLTASEILDLKLNAELVVLSACDTGEGRLTGDGVIGLSRSIIAAGVPSVIVSLWSIPDAP